MRSCAIGGRTCLKAYSQAKQSLRMIAWIHAKQRGADNVTVNAVSPGFVKTDFNEDVGGRFAGVFRIMAMVIGVTPDGAVGAAAHRPDETELLAVAVLEPVLRQLERHGLGRRLSGGDGVTAEGVLDGVDGIAAVSFA